MELNQRYLNRQLGRVLQTLGSTGSGCAGIGPYLIDDDGREYLDLYAGYGVFGLGRNHPYVKEQLKRLIDSDPPSLPQLGISTAGWAAGRSSWCERTGAARRRRAHQLRHRVGRGGAEARPRRHRTYPHPLLRARLSRALLRARCRSTATTSSASASGRCCPAASRCPFGDLGRARAGARHEATSQPSSSSRCRARASTSLPTATCSAPRDSATSPARC